MDVLEEPSELSLVSIGLLGWKGDVAYFLAIDCIESDAAIEEPPLHVLVKRGTDVDFQRSGGKKLFVSCRPVQ